MRASLQVSTQVGPGQAVLRLAGDCDEDTEQSLGESLTKVLAQAPPVLEIDLSGLNFGDSSLLHALLRALRAQESRQGRLVLRGPLSSRVRQLFRQSGTMGVFEDCLEEGGNDGSRRSGTTRSAGGSDVGEVAES
ncbi:STAS domain-containing protein [Streptomyces sp. SID14478]|uniref:STAS domain-containing protein n=1 Tax=Streptomyces sp. SID14478 TaxID=2706073 RepID=UPI0013DFD5D5|nr:STAS domain-containing protein [Streptomyces sp. SID14478]NEB81904.1 STAS domain-containing protein [Streptomyces sp. SID14478]